MREGIYTLCINGSMYHQIGTDVVSEDSAEAKFAQIYMLDDDMQCARRQDIFNNELDASIITRIHDLLHEENTIVQSFKTAREVLGDDINDMQLQITGDVASTKIQLTNK